jgi:hypothetical protein
MHGASLLRQALLLIFVHRQADASSFAAQTYKLTIPTSAGTLTLPALGGSLTLTGKDSKIHVVDYEAGSTTLLYSTGEIATWYVVTQHVAFSSVLYLHSTW